MGKKEYVSSPLFWAYAVQRSVGRTLREAGERPSGITTQMDIPGNLHMERVLSAMVGEVIGQRVVLHSLLEPTDFAVPYSGNGISQSSPQHWEAEEAPFQVLFSTHRILSEFQCVTIVSEGCMGIAGGRKVDFRMELSLERISLSLTSAAMQRAPGRGPLTLSFGSNPMNLTEAAFSFDIDQEGASPAVPCSGCGFLAILSPSANTCGEHHRPATIGTGGCG